MKKDSKNQRRRQKLREREQAKKQRTVVIRDGEKRTVLVQAAGYDVDMVRDFLDQLLVELRSYHYENVKILRSLKAGENPTEAITQLTTTPTILDDQFIKIDSKYMTSLLPITTADVRNATESEVKEVMTAILEGEVKRKDEMIGHLEALQPLLADVFSCAKMPSGFDQHGNHVQPRRVYNIREIVDQARASALPKYEELLPLFSDHPFATEEGIALLKRHDRSHVILATNDVYPDPLVLFGDDIAEKHRRAGTSVMAVRIQVSSFSELQFVIAAIHKVVGMPSTDGTPWKDLNEQ